MQMSRTYAGFYHIYSYSARSVRGILVRRMCMIRGFIRSAYPNRQRDLLQNIKRNPTFLHYANNPAYHL